MKAVHCYLLSLHVTIYSRHIPFVWWEQILDLDQNTEAGVMDCLIKLLRLPSKWLLNVRLSFFSDYLFVLSSNQMQMIPV